MKIYFKADYFKISGCFSLHELSLNGGSDEMVKLEA